MQDQVAFYLNGDPVVIEGPSPSLMLIDFLRSPEVRLMGAKKGCGQGGCGSCTVILSRWDEASRMPEHRAINSCLRPVCSLGGLAVTTIEGTGSTRKAVHPFLSYSPSSSRHGVLGVPKPTANWLERRNQLETGGAPDLLRRIDLRTSKNSDPQPRPSGMNPVAHRLAANNGSQCGYCSAGFVMNMTAFLARNPHRTKREIEDLFDGNICRCTGYRAILTGMKTFASDWSEADEEQRMKCVLDVHSARFDVQDSVSIAFPPEAEAPESPVRANGDGQTWSSPRTLVELLELMKDLPRPRMVFANTSFGIYKDEFLEAEHLVDLRLIHELRGATRSAAGLSLGAATTYAQLLELQGPIPPEEQSARSGALNFMCRRTAGSIVRNAASIGGNTMLVLHHISNPGVEPFPSDLFTALVAVGAEVEFARISTGETHRSKLEVLMEQVISDQALSSDLVLLRFLVQPNLKEEVVLAQKVALRAVNSHTIVNATTRFRFESSTTVEEVDLVFGGVAPHAWRPRATEAAIRGTRLSLAGFDELAATLESETRAELKKWSSRVAGLPDEGFTADYRVELTVSFLYKSIVHALLQRDATAVPTDIASCGGNSWGTWGVTEGRQHWKSQEWKSPVSVPYIKAMAMDQTQGEVHYTHEINIPNTGVNGALIQSSRALADFHYVQPGSSGTPVSREELSTYLRQEFEDFVALIGHRQVPGHNLQGMGADQPIFASSQVSYVGQAIGMVLARTERAAQRIAHFVESNAVAYTPVKLASPWDRPVLSIEEAIRRGSVFPDAPAAASFNSHIWRIERPGSRFDWAELDRDPLERSTTQKEGSVGGVPCLTIIGSQTTGGQAHFYMETQASVAVPEDGERLIVHPSSQSPMEMHQTTADALGVEYSRVQMDLRQLGGGFGGKTEQARFVTGAVAVAAHSTGLPVRMALEREADTALIGKRHPYYGQYQIAVDTGELNPEDRGLVRGVLNRMWGDGGAFYDCSFVVANNIQLRSDNAYQVQNFRNQIDVCRTNKAPNTAFRSFGDIQSKIISETAYDDAAVALGMDPADLREKNMYRQGDVTPFGQALSDCYMRDVWEFLTERCNYAEKKSQVEAWNRNNRWRKRAVYMLPVKYGSGYNLLQLEQATAVVSVYAGDGSIVIHQGGVDMGQGIHTISEQVASYVLNVPMEMIRIENPKTNVIPNPSSTGASTGTTYSAESVRRVCHSLRSRMLEFGHRLREERGGDWCRSQRVDFWNHPEGWAHNVSPEGQPKRLIWQNLVALAYQHRIPLVESFTAPIRGGETRVPWMIFKPMDQQPEIPDIPIVEGLDEVDGIVDSFSGFTYSAACSTVEVDILTGETKILSSDIVYDMGWSLNPAIDIGQVEGAFVQGIGYLLTEKLVFESDGEEAGRLNSLNTWRYKPPAISTIPLELNTWLFPRDLPANVAENPNEVLSSKDVGEPPLVLSASVFFAVKAAIRASRIERDLPPLFRLDAPATVQEVRRACELTAHDLTR